MTKSEFLSSLRENLHGLSEEDIKKPLDYYSEMIDDRIEDGMTEEEAVVDVGTPDECANAILMDMPLSKVVKAKIKKERSVKWWEILLIVLGAPLWFPLLMAVLSVVLAVVVTLFSVVVVFAACVIVLVVCGLFFVAVGIWELFRAMLASGLFGIGIGLAAIGCGILATLLVILAVKFSIWLLKAFARLIKSLFISKGDAQ